MLTEFEGSEGDHGTQQAEDPKPDNYLTFLPPLEFEMMVNGSHLEEPPGGAINFPAQLEPTYLHHHGQGLEYKDSTRDDQDDLLFGADGDSRNTAPNGQTAGI